VIVFGAVLLVSAPPSLLFLLAVLADKAGEAEWKHVQQAWDAYSPTATGALHREVLDRSQHLL